MPGSSTARVDVNDSGSLGAPSGGPGPDVEEHALVPADLQRRRMTGGDELELPGVGLEPGEEQRGDLDVVPELVQEAVEPGEEIAEVLADARVRHAWRDEASPSGGPSSSRAR